MPKPIAVAGTRSPWIIRWPGVVKPGSKDSAHFISSIDFAPTILDALGLDQLSGSDGRSFLPLLKGEPQQGREGVLTRFDETAARNCYRMRAWQDKEYLYIWNGWADGTTVFKNESQAGITMKAMQDAAANDPAIAARVKHFLYRAKEELYDLKAGPHSLKNLAASTEASGKLQAYRSILEQKLSAVGDPQLDAFVRSLQH